MQLVINQCQHCPAVPDRRIGDNYVVNDYENIAVEQWSFRGGTRGNTIPIVEALLERTRMVVLMKQYVGVGYSMVQISSIGELQK